MLLHFKGVTFKIDKSEIEDLSKGRNLKKGHALLTLLSQKKKSKHGPGIVLFKPRRIHTGRSTARESQGEITKQDVLDLIIDLQVSGSVDAFLNLLDSKGDSPDKA